MSDVDYRFSRMISKLENKFFDCTSKRAGQGYHFSITVIKSNTS